MVKTLNPVVEPVKKTSDFKIQYLKQFIYQINFLRIFSGDKSNQHDTGRLIPIKPGAVK